MAAPVRSYLVQRLRKRALRMPERGIEGVETAVVEQRLFVGQNPLLDADQRFRAEGFSAQEAMLRAGERRLAVHDATPAGEIAPDCATLHPGYGPGYDE